MKSVSSGHVEVVDAACDICAVLALQHESRKYRVAFHDD